MIKTAGIIGGIGPESTIEYYRLIVRAWREAKDDGSYPQIVINSIDLSRVVDLMTKGAFSELADLLLNEVQKLARAGADFGALAANTPHVVFDDLQRRSPIPLISIVEATCQAACTLGLKRAALLGTRFTMSGRFYPEVFSKAHITLFVPAEDEQQWVHEKYMNELVNGISLPQTRDRLLLLIDRMIERHEIEAVILGGTELPLILHDVPCKAMLLDTTKIHADRIVAELLGVP
jgi:aspartate racemase